MTKNRNRKQAVRRYQQTHDVAYMKAARHHDTITLPSPATGDLPDLLPFPEPGSRDFDEAIRLAREGVFRIGIDDTGRWVDWDLNTDPHGLIGGKTGAGKSMLLTIVAFYAMWLPDEYQLIVCDPKHLDFAWTAEFPNVVHARTDHDICSAVSDAKHQMDQRISLLSNQHVRNLNQLRSKGSETVPPRLLLLFDEMTDFLTRSSNEDFEAIKAEARGDLESIGSMGRAVGVNIIGAAQNPYPSIMSTRLRALLGFRVGVGRLAPFESQNILHSDHGTRFPDEEIPTGRSWAYDSKSGYRMAQLMFLSPEDLPLPGDDAVTMRGAGSMLREHLAGIERTAAPAESGSGGPRPETTGMTIVFLARGDDDTLVCVAAEGDREPRFFVGSGSPLREVPLAGDQMERFQVLRDGGTTEVTTEEGIFRVPSPLRSNPYKPGAVTWQGRPFTLMDVGTTSAYLTGEGLVLH